MNPSTFADLPELIEARVRAGDRVLVVLLDAFGWAFAQRHADHPLLRRLDARRPMPSQFPSTTTAHVTTMHTGLPVGEHGLYEWNVLEPELGRIVTPLRCTYAGEAEGDLLVRDGFDVRRLLPEGPSFYERLGVPSAVFQPSRFSPSTFDGVAARGTDLRPFEDLEGAVAGAVSFLASVPSGYAYVYWDWIDATGHLHGPSSPEFRAATEAALDAVDAGLRDARDVLVLLTADHGQVDVDPDDTIWLDELHPPLAGGRLRPAGSGRDVFLHVDEAEVEPVLGALRPHVEAVRVTDLLARGAFGASPGPRLRERLGSVCVLPPPGRMAWLRSALDPGCFFRGHHGGLAPEEATTWLGTLRA